MGILKSTKAGKAGIKITEEYLLNKGWFVNNSSIYPPSEKTKLSHDRYIRFYEIVEDGKQIKSFYINLKKGGSYNGIRYEVQINTIDDLELLEKYWNSKGKDKTKYRDKLFSRGKSMPDLWWTMPSYNPKFSRATVISSKNLPPTEIKVIPESENTYCEPKKYVFDVKLTPIKK